MWNYHERAKVLRITRQAQFHCYQIGHGVGLGYLLMLAREDGLDLSSDDNLLTVILAAEQMATRLPTDERRYF
jgi:hypothetical protein